MYLLNWHSEFKDNPSSSLLAASFVNPVRKGSGIRGKKVSEQNGPWCDSTDSGFKVHTETLHPGDFVLGAIEPGNRQYSVNLTYLVHCGWQLFLCDTK